jgi:hypothetical protein
MNEQKLPRLPKKTRLLYVMQKTIKKKTSKKKNLRQESGETTTNKRKAIRSTDLGSASFSMRVVDV